MRVRIILLLLVTAAANALAQDSILLYSRGNIMGRVFEVEEILIRPSCACVGACTCAKTCETDYAESRFSTTDAILAKSSSISLIRRGNFALEPVLNGMASDRLNLTIDGMKVFGACTDKMDPVTSYVEPNNMKTLTVQHGSAGSMFGSSIAGSVNMETQGATISPDRPWSGEVGAGFSSAALGANGLLSLNYSRKRWAVRVGGTYRRFQNYRAGGGRTVDFSQFEKWNGSLSARYMVTERNILRFDMILDEAYNVGYPALPMDVLFAKARIFGLTHLHLPAADWFERLETKVYVNTVSHSMDDTKRPNVPMHMDMPGSTRTMGGYMDGTFRKGRHMITARLDGYHSNARAEMTMYPENDAPMFMLTWPDVDRLSMAMFLQDNIRFNDRRSLGFNARLEYLSSIVTDDFGVRQASVFDQDVGTMDHRLLKNASITFQEQLKGGFVLHATGGFAERAPTVTEQYGFYIFNAYDGFDHIGAVGLETEKAVQAEAGMRWSGRTVSMRLSGFYYHLMDYILAAADSTLDAMTIDANGVKVMRNIPEAIMTGAHLDLSWSPLKVLTITSNSTYTHGTAHDGTPLPLIPPFRNVSSVKWSHRNGFVQLECESAASQTRVSPEFGERATASYAILNIRAGHSFQIRTTRLAVNAGIENLLDTRYRTHLDWGGIPRPGINGFVNLSLSF